MLMYGPSLNSNGMCSPSDRPLPRNGLCDAQLLLQFLERTAAEYTLTHRPPGGTDDRAAHACGLCTQPIHFVTIADVQHVAWLQLPAFARAQEALGMRLERVDVTIRST